LILHLIQGLREQSHASVSAETVESVDRLIRDFILPHAFEFYRTAETITNGDRLQRIASFILISGKSRIVSSDLTTNVRLFRGLTMAEINAQLSPLIAGAWLAPETSGPQATAWHVNPIIKEMFAEKTTEEERRKQTLADLMNSNRKGRREAL